MSIKALRALIAIEQQGSFAAAADKLGLTQAAISQQIKQLETQLKTPLFEKVGRTMLLNHDGRIVLSRAVGIVAAYDGLADGIGSHGQFVGELRVGAVFSVQIGPLGAVLAELREAFPELSIQVYHGMSDELMARVESNELDAVLITEPLSGCGVGCWWTTLDVEPFYVVAPTCWHEPDSLSLLQNHPYIRFNPRAFAGALIDQELERAGVTTNEVMQLDSLQSATTMVEQRLGITIMPLGAALYDKYKTQFRLVPFGEPQLTRRVGCYQKREHSRSQLVDVLLKSYLRCLDS